VTFVLDASAVLAVLLGEPGRTRVLELWDSAVVSAPNLAETLTVLTDRGHPRERVAAVRDLLRPSVCEFGADAAELAADLRHATRHLGLSLGDRCCLAAGILRHASVVTADRKWARLDIGIPVEVIR
jgi:PIN domain nuclease of toxin-antitoxin system